MLQRRGDEVVGLGGHGCRLGDGGGLRGGAHRLEVGHHAEQRGAEQGGGVVTAGGHPAAFAQPPGIGAGTHQAEHPTQGGVAHRGGLRLGAQVGRLEELHAGAVEGGIDGDLVDARLQRDALGDCGVALGLQRGVVWVAGDVGLESVDAGVDDRLGVHQLGDRGFGIVGNLGLHLVLIGLADGVGELLGTRGGGVFGDDGDQVEVT